jgi:hypothetical protein
LTEGRYNLTEGCYNLAEACCSLAEGYYHFASVNFIYLCSSRLQLTFNKLPLALASGA